MPVMDIHERLKRWREGAGLKQKQAARALDLDLDKYRRFEYGTQIPKGDDRDRIERILARNKVLDGTD